VSGHLFRHRHELDDDVVEVEQVDWVVNPRHQIIEQVVTVADSKSKQVGFVDLENTAFVQRCVQLRRLRPWFIVHS